MCPQEGYNWVNKLVAAGKCGQHCGEPAGRPGSEAKNTVPRTIASCEGVSCLSLLSPYHTHNSQHLSYHWPSFPDFGLRWGNGSQGQLFQKDLWANLDLRLLKLAQEARALIWSSCSLALLLTCLFDFVLFYCGFSSIVKNLWEKF
jgi:hypothetical protein